MKRESFGFFWLAAILLFGCARQQGPVSTEPVQMKESRETVVATSKIEEPRVVLNARNPSIERSGDNYLIKLEATLLNEGNDTLFVRSNFFSAFDGLGLVIMDMDGNTLMTVHYTHHQSPLSQGKDYPIVPGPNVKEMGFPVIEPISADRILVKLSGTLPGVDLEGSLESDELELSVPFGRQN